MIFHNCSTEQEAYIKAEKLKHEGYRVEVVFLEGKFKFPRSSTKDIWQVKGEYRSEIKFKHRIPSDKPRPTDADLKVLIEEQA